MGGSYIGRPRGSYIGAYGFCLGNFLGGASPLLGRMSTLDPPFSTEDAHTNVNGDVDEVLPFHAKQCFHYRRQLILS
jgi:hypothetical protein